MEQRFVAFEQATGLSLTVYDLHGRLSAEGLPKERILHASPFCLAVKRKKERVCIACDHEQLFMECLERRSCFIRTCHAGADEVIIPVTVGDELRCVGLLGQFIRDERTDRPASPLPDLPTVTAGRAQHLTAMGEILRGFLSDDMSRSPHSKTPPLADRIQTFIVDNLTADPRLEDLAEILALSVSRTRHLVKEVCGEGYQKLKDRIRLKAAKELLHGTTASLRFVARQSGFNDADYFCRFFKKRMGMTPSRYRESGGRVSP